MSTTNLVCIPSPFDGTDFSRSLPHPMWLFDFPLLLARVWYDLYQPAKFSTSSYYLLRARSMHNIFHTPCLHYGCYSSRSKCITKNLQPPKAFSVASTSCIAGFHFYLYFPTELVVDCHQCKGWAGRAMLTLTVI